MSAGDWEFEAHPHLLRRQAALWTVVLGGGALFGWFMLPLNIRVLFTGLQIATLAFFVAFMLGIVWVLAFGEVRAGPAGLLVRNGLRTHQIGWDQVVSIRYRPADHWAFVEMSDDTDRPLLGIQRSDGPLAQQRVDELREVAARYRTTPPH